MSTFYSYFLSNFKRLCFGGEERKFVGLTKISHLFHSQPKTSFSLYVLVWIALISAASAFPQFFFFFLFSAAMVDLFFCEQCTCALFTDPQTPFLSPFSLKMGPTVLFTHLKIILLQCFQFSVFSFSKISSIQTYPTFLSFIFHPPKDHSNQT